MPFRVTVVITLLAICAGASFGSDDSPDFVRDVQPVFVEKCGRCHSDKVQKGDLNLSSMTTVAKGGESGENLLAESLDENYLWTLVEDGEMPPADEPRLSKKQKETIRRWIESGQHGASPSEASEPMTEHDVLPIVLLRCITCHGPQRTDGGVDLRSVESMLKGGKNGPALKPGDPSGSLMIQRIESEACPPRHLLLKFFVRRPPQHEVDLLRKWIAEGAPRGDIQPDVATTEPDSMVTDEERGHWAYIPPKRPAHGNSVDDFIAEKLGESSLTFSPQANRDTLIRRVYLDLIGMPPTHHEWQRWRTSDDPNWYRQMVDQVLASPHYGERWGRYWLDLAGYADSEGGISADPIRTLAWRYRDYVIKAFNEDKPYDEFLVQQLAGDELVDYKNADAITQQQVENLVATGFLRMGIDETGSRTMNFVPERLKVISDAITVVSSGLMGMTMECARCHSHKYDPIPQRDYYRLKAVFQGALDEHNWHSFKTRKVNLATKEQLAKIKATNPPLEKQVRKLQSSVRELTREIQLLLLRHHYPDQSEGDNQATITALKIADNNRTLPQRILVEKLQVAEVAPESDQPESVKNARQQLVDLNREIQHVRAKMVTPATIRALWDLGQPSPTYILRHGEHNKPGRLVGPGVPSVLTNGKTPFEIQPPFPKGTPKTGRRLAFARWLTRGDHPLTARVMINRIWKQHFGVGLVKDVDNFGAQAELPSHPELLDWLAIEFVRRGWSIKEMHRLMMNSKTYRQSSRVSQDRSLRDPNNRLLSRMSIRRMDAEALRDSLLLISGRLDPASGGVPDAVTVDRNGQVNVFETAGGGWRRSVYLQFRRTEIPTMMDTFDYPQMGPNCLSRNESTVSPQSLMLMNNQHVRQLASAFAKRIEELAGTDASVENRVELIFKIALSRSPSEQEKTIASKTLARLNEQWGNENRALETFCHTILNSASFLFVD